VSVTLVLASRNAKKVREMDRILRSAGLDVNVVSAQDVAPEMPDVAETEPTFMGNALLKARAVAAHTGLMSVADDSGLCVDELQGMPGVLSARWAGIAKSDEANLLLLLEQLSDTPSERRGAQFRCAVALVTPQGREITVEGQMVGRLINEPRGTGGFGYDPIFVPEGHDITTAQMDPETKDAASHRGDALRQLVPLLRDLLSTEPASGT
jgi:XTP/dITP diphosphohydrolase